MIIFQITYLHLLLFATVVLAILLLVDALLIWLDKRHRRIFCVPGGIVLVALLMCVVLVGNERNTVRLQCTGVEWLPDQFELHFNVMKPLVTEPVVDYTVTKNAKGEKDVVLTVLKNVTGVPKSGVHRATVRMIDEHRLVVTFPYTPVAFFDVPTAFFIGKENLCGRIGPAIPKEESPIIETEEEQE